MSLQKAARDALDAQMACNLSGIVHAFSRHLTTLWGEANKRGEGTDWVNRHPISRLFAEQIAWLATGSCIGGPMSDYSAASDACKQLSMEDEPCQTS